jgi:hypothetical protein
LLQAILAENLSCVFCISAIHGGREPARWHSVPPSIAENKKDHYQKIVAFFIFGWGRS